MAKQKVQDLDRRRFLRYSAFGVAGLSMLPAWTNGSEVSAVQKNNRPRPGSPRIAIISDTHLVDENSVEKVSRTLKALTSKNPVDAIFVVGDITNNGQEKEYDQVVSVFNNPENIPESVKIYYLMGNHDNHTGKKADELFKEKLKQDLHQYVVIKGYPFITISMTGSRGQSYNEEAQQFLSEKLAEAARNFPKKPIFVFHHIPSLNTCYGSTPWGQDVLTPILSRYPQAIVFAGHSHSTIGEPRSIHQNKFTAVNTGSVAYCEMEPGVLTVGTYPENNQKVLEGLIMNILANGNVEIERWDTFRNEEILPRWLVEAPHDGSNFTYKKAHPMPQFADGIKPEVKLNGTTCEVTFPQATDDEVVFLYAVEIVVPDNLNESVASQRIFSQFYLNSQKPEKLTVSFPDLPTDRPFCAMVTAIDSYNGLSLPIRSNIFSIKK
jgi:predicted phosphodiesterase